MYHIVRTLYLAYFLWYTVVVLRSLCNLSSSSAATVSIPQSKGKLVRRRGGEEEKRGEERGKRVSPFREPPLDGVHVHQLSVVVLVRRRRGRPRGERGGMVFAMWNCFIVLFLLGSAVSDGRRPTAVKWTRERFRWRTQTRKSSAWILEWNEFRLSSKREGKCVLNQELQLVYNESKCQNQELQDCAQERPGRGEKNGRKTLKALEG